VTKRAVAIAIADPDRPGLVLLVQRPDDDPDLPHVWGLPAATLAGDESWHDAARRAGRDKLGVELQLGPVLEQGEVERPGYRLQMRLLHATIRDGTPTVPQSDPNITQYQAARWGSVPDLQHAADCGSLCARLCLAWHAASEP
jgi:ADP-ribose pyrophosphatase YjhB (NUDIX family)